MWKVVPSLVVVVASGLVALALLGCDGAGGNGDAASGDAPPGDERPVDPSQPPLAEPSGLDPLEGHGDLVEVSSGHFFTEGPVWIARKKVLRFTDTRTEEIFEIGADGSVKQWRTESGRANGLCADDQGRMIVCEGGNRRVTRSVYPDESAVLAEAWQGKRLNQPNDNVVGRDGTIYFTDPHYGRGRSEMELPFEGVFRIDRGGVLHLVSDALERPNGIALSRDGRRLYVADNARSEIVVFDVRADGATGPERERFATGKGPDGMVVDDDGNLYVATAAGIDVHHPDGTPRGNIPIPQRPTNCAFGGPGRRTLYVTARKSVYAVKLKVPGRP